ncbi:MAG: hypothetical protein ABJE66_10520 [Deltaproteobacteria bacterium]
MTEGLDYTSDAHDFMDFNVCTSGCSFADAGDVIRGARACPCAAPPAWKTPATKLRAALGN